MVSIHPQSLVVYVLFLILTFSVIAPEFALNLWLAILGVFEERKAKRRARKSRQFDEKMKKYWVIDMRKLR